MEDAQIIELFFKRSQEALTAVQSKYGRYLRSIAGRILKTSEDAEEVLNDTLLRTWNTIPPRRPERLELYMGKIIRNLSIDRLDSRNTAKRGGEYALALDELAEVLPDSQGENLADDYALKDVMSRFVHTLPTEARRIFLRRYWYFYSVREIAQAMNIGESKVKMSLSRTRTRLKEFLEQEEIAV